MTGGWRAGALLVGLMLFAGACTPTGTAQTQTSPATSPASLAGSSPPSTSPAESLSPTPEALPTPSPSPSPIPARLIITSLSYNVGEVGIGYSPVTAGASGGTPPYKWSIDGGALPTGLAMSPGGTVSGTPGTAGGFSFVVRVDDAGGQAAGVPRSINVAAALTATGRCTTATSCSVEEGCVTVCGTYTDLAGGVMPYTFAVTGGALPPGMSLNGPALAGPFPLKSGTTAAPPPYQFAVTVSDALGATSQVTSFFSVFQHIGFFPTQSGTCLGFFVSGCNTQLAYTGGTPNGIPSVQVTQDPLRYPPLPSGSKFTASLGVVSVAIPGSACPSSDYVAVVTLVLVDQNQCGPGVNCSSGLATLTVTLRGC